MRERIRLNQLLSFIRALLLYVCTTERREDRTDQRKRKAAEKASSHDVDRQKKQRISSRDEARGARNKAKAEVQNAAESTKR